MKLRRAAAVAASRAARCSAAAARASSSTACSASRASRARELRPRLACLLDDPVVLAGGAAEAVEPGERLVERLGAQQNRERVALVRPFVESPDEYLELRLGDTNGLLGDSELLRGGGAVLRDLGPAGGEGAEIALCAAKLALQRVQLEGGGARARLERAGAGTQLGRLRLGRVRAETGGVGGKGDRNGRQQGEARQDGHEARRAPR